jgi:hypothetical protein
LGLGNAHVHLHLPVKCVCLQSLLQENGKTQPHLRLFDPTLF